MLSGGRAYASFLQVIAGLFPVFCTGQYGASGSGTISGAGLSGTISSYTAGMGPVCYPSACTGSFKGFFAGAGAAYGGFVYKIDVPASFSINGAIAFH